MSLIADSSTDIYYYLQAWPDNAPDKEKNIEGLGDILGMVYNIVLGIALAASIISLIMAGIKFILSRGEPKAVAQARTTLTYSVVAFILAIAGFTIKIIIFNLLGGDVGDLRDTQPKF